MSNVDPVPGTLHQFSSDPELTCFEHAVSGGPSSNVVLIIPGLNGSYPPVPYTRKLSRHIQQHCPGWTVVELGGMTSAGAGWGASSVLQDAKEIAQCVTYLEQVCNKQKIVLMGHSTGCQDAIAYTHLRAQQPSSASEVAGIILQAPLSDREFVLATAPTKVLPLIVTQYPGLTPHPGQTYKDFVDKRLSDLFGTKLGITYERWNSLTSKAESDKITWENEDYFSSDMSSKRWRNVFEPIRQQQTPTLVVLGGKDEGYARGMDTANKLWQKFKDAAEGLLSAHSLINAESDHAVSDDASRQQLFDAVTRFIKDL
ncbi:hypothetical protein OIV83_002932 [Microbotryomycetes sp. JL201]|nr:hypothetical protein OIV83_002932 [Microbotryomycetes sp. JL201]